MTEIRNFLEHQKAQNGEKNLYQHISNVLGKMLLDNTEASYDKFEEYSHDVKLSSYDYKKDTNFDHKSRLRENYNDVKDWADKTSTALEKLNVGTEEEPQEPGQCGAVPNLPEEMKKFEWAGIHFGEEETFLLQKSLTKLAHSSRAKTIRLWGKIFGSEKDYYIVEADGVEAAGEEELPADAEPRGTGVNKFSYFVTNDVLGDWVELPLITPKHINMARKIKHIFTGNLEANIITNPFFFGKEKHYLKAQIVRCTYNTTIVPKGLWKLTEEEDSRDVEYEEVFNFPTLQKALDPNNWVHINTNILKEGKIAHSEAPEEVEDKDLWLVQRKKIDPFEPRLKPISQDRAPEGQRKAWIIKHYGDLIDYDTVSKPVNKTNYGVVAIKSTVWPGLTTLIFDGTQQTIYVGYGFKAGVKAYYPTFTKNVCEDPADPEEQPEPNPTNLPPKQETAEGAEGGAGEEGANEEEA